MSGKKPVVFLGPSMPLEEARAILDAEYRRPIRRGDLEGLESGIIVGVVDGVFEQDLAVSQTEIREAVRRGVHLFGSSSMGALRAAEVPGMVGLGKIYRMYARGELIRDDEVALLFEAESGMSLTEPMVNIRHGVERLISSATLSSALGAKIVSTAEAMHFKDRSLQRILKLAGVSESEIRMTASALRSHNLKKEDAHLLLQHLRSLKVEELASSRVAAHEGFLPVVEEVDSEAATLDPGSALLWELGDRVEWEDLLTFLQLTGGLGQALTRLASRSTAHEPLQLDVEEWKQRIQGAVRALAARWGWATEEEIRTTLHDLGFALQDLQRLLPRRLGEEIVGRRRLRESQSTIRAELLLDGLSLKQGIARLGSLVWWSERGRRNRVEVDSELLESSRRKLVTCFGVGTWQRYLGFAEDTFGSVKPAERLAEDLALARAGAGELLGRLDSKDPDPPPAPDPGAEERVPMTGIPGAEQQERIRRIAEEIGVTRIALIGELTRLGPKISQVSRPDGTWSSTYGSGKGESPEEAVLGGIFEEIEKWSQERFSERENPGTPASFAELKASVSEQVVDPADLPLPYDSIYHPDLPIDWSTGHDEMSASPVNIPAAAVHRRRFANDIMLSRRAGRRISDTNGLASGFSREHAVLHGLCEVVERHATRLVDLRAQSSGGLDRSSYAFIAPETVRVELKGLIEHVGAPLSLLDITSEIRIPTVLATLSSHRGGVPYLCQGWGCHPDPHLAVRRAVLEACQTLAVATAGAREDLTLKARSLGRHERPRPMAGNEAGWWFDPDRETISVDDIPGLDGRFHGTHEGLAWSLDRLLAAGIKSAVVVDLSQPETRPTITVRVVVPGLESINPFHTGPRGRMVVLEGLLPRLPHGPFQGRLRLRKDKS